MRNRFCFVLFLVCSYCDVFAQTPVEKQWENMSVTTADLNVNDLKQRLSSATGKQRIIFLSLTGLAYAYRLNLEDSARNYATMAHEEAVRPEYGKEIFFKSLAWRIDVEMHFNRPQTAKSLAIQGIKAAKYFRSDEWITEGYTFLGSVLTTLGDYNYAQTCLDSAEFYGRKIKDEKKWIDIYSARSKLFSKINRMYDAIYYLNKVAAIYKKSGRQEDYAKELGTIGKIYFELKDYKNALYYYKNEAAYYLQKEAAEEPDCVCGPNYEKVASVYAELKNYDSALYYIEKVISRIQRLSSNSVTKQKELMNAYATKGGIYVKEGMSDEALNYLLPSLQFYKESNNMNAYIRVLSLVGSAYAYKEEYDKTLSYGRQLVQLSHLNHSEKELIRGYELLAISFENTGHSDSAFHYLKLSVDSKSATTKDEVTNNIVYYKTITENEIAGQRIEWLNNDNQLKEQRLQLLYKDNKIKQQNLELLDQDNKIKEQNLELLNKENQLKQRELDLNIYKGKAENEKSSASIDLLNNENRLKQQKLNFLVLGLIGFVLLAVAVIRSFYLRRKNEAHRNALLKNEMDIQRLENEKRQASMEQRVTELEMQALRAQMNPHFIFNCLNAINHFVLKNDTEAASDYLTKFSRLIRMVLQNSSKKNISLADELSTLKLYVALEQVRFKNHFDFSIFIDEEIDTESLMIPPLLLQPFVENAIWHGLMPKKNQGRLNIEIVNDKGVLECIIVDNGIGRQNALRVNSDSAKKRSMGIQITESRLNMLNDESRKDSLLCIIDLKDDHGDALGTKIIIRIPVSVSKTVAA